MPELTTQTKTFLLLVILAALGTYGASRLTSERQDQAVPSPYRGYQVTRYEQKQPEPQAVAPAEEPKPADTTGWRSYTNQPLGLSFNLPPAWKVLPVKKRSGYDVITIDPGQKFSNLEFYVSRDGYYALSGLPTSETTVGGKPGLTVKHLLYGTENAGRYYTFDLGYSLTLQPEFLSIVGSVAFVR